MLPWMSDFVSNRQKNVHQAYFCKGVAYGCFKLPEEGKDVSNIVFFVSFNSISFAGVKHVDVP